MDRAALAEDQQLLAPRRAERGHHCEGLAERTVLELERRRRVLLGAVDEPRAHGSRDGGDDPFHVAGEEADEVEAVHADADHGAAAGAGAVVLPVSGGKRPPVLDRVRLHRADLAELSRRDDRARRLVARQEALVLRHHQRRAGAIGGRDHLAAVPERDCERLLDEHVPARRDGRERDRRVLVGCHADVERVARDLAQQRVDIGVDPLDSGVVRAPSRQPFVEIADRDELDLLRKLRIRGEMVRCDVACTDECNSQRGHFVISAPRPRERASSAPSPCRERRVGP